MSFTTQFQARGAFDLDSSTRPGQPLHADVFRPPPSPSTSSYNLAKSTGSLFSDISMSTAQPTGTAKRKRTTTRESTPMDWHMSMEGAHDGREEERSREFRRALGPKADPPAEGSYTQQPAKVAATASSFAGWTLLSLQTIGDMVGKVWEFCKTGAVFKGFRGGGGQAYDANGSTVTETTGESWAPESDPPLHPPGDYPITDQEAPAY
ncbi:uncharacterized protein THITE_2019147, partial [Thermothielavioides terrestris NRRL 8126]